MKILITDNQLRKVQFKYLDYLFDGMREIELEDYPDSIFWEKDGKVILELRKSGQLRVLSSIWNDISNMFSYEYNQIQQLIKEWAEQHLELQEITPCSCTSCR